MPGPKRKKTKAASSDAIPLAHPDRSKDAPPENTLLKWAQERDLFSQADAKMRQNAKKRADRPAVASTDLKEDSGQDGDDDIDYGVDDDSNDDDDDEDDGNNSSDDNDDDDGLTPGQEQFMDTLLYSVSLTMLHFSLDVLVHHQYAVSIEWNLLIFRSLRMLLFLALLFFILHPHKTRPLTLLPGLPAHYQSGLRQTIFFTMSTVAGCLLIHATNNYSYLAVLKQAPMMGCFWVWAVIELDLSLAMPSLAVCTAYLYWNGYSIR